MSIAGAVAVLCFYRLVERHWLLLTSTRRDYNIVFYGRYMDDGIIVVDCPRAHFRPFFDEMRSRSRGFEIKVESVSVQEASMLDISL